jgi:hypothetical protein
MIFACYRNCWPGLIDFCGLIEAANVESAENIARSRYDCDDDEELIIEEEQESS